MRDQRQQERLDDRITESGDAMGVRDQVEDHDDRDRIEHQKAEGDGFSWGVHTREARKGGVEAGLMASFSIIAGNQPEDFFPIPPRQPGR